MLTKNKANRIMRLTSFLIVSMLCMTIMGHAAERVSNTHSLVGDWFNKVFSITLTDGSSLLDTKEDKLDRLAANDDIFNSDNKTNVTYSLYDRFGGDIRFIPYFGEVRIETGIFDEFYTKVLNNDGKMKLTLDDIKLFLQESSVSNNVIYTGRPNILSKQDIDAGYVDPRVAAYSGVGQAGGDAKLGNIGLLISNSLVSLVSFVSSSKLFDTITGLLNVAIKSGVGIFLSEMVAFLLPIAIFAFLLQMIKHVFGVIRGDAGSRSLLAFLGNSLISLGLIYLLAAQPMILTKSFAQIVGIFDHAFDHTVAEVVKDEVTVGDNTKNVREAILWKNAVLQPWCIGQFGDTYEHLYTSYADLGSYGDKADVSTMPQSNDDVDVEWDDNQARYNSVKYTGNPAIPVGLNNNVRNWAALAWSCNSLYHIDATDLEYARQIPSVWPKAELTPENNQIYVDNFRWLDAMLDISPEYRNVDNVYLNYSGSKSYSERFVHGGNLALMMSLLLLPLLNLSLRKMKLTLRLVCAGFVMIKDCMLHFVLPDRYGPMDSFAHLGKNLLDLMWFTLAVFICTLFYGNMVSVVNPAGDVLYLAVAVYLNLAKPVTSTAEGARLAVQSKQALVKINNRLKHTALNLKNQILHP